MIDPIAEVQGGATVADWVGAIGTVVVGVMAAAIAFMQYRHGKFRPRSEAFRDKDWRVKVQITNDGAGAGWVVDVHLTRPTYHTTGDVEFYVWEIDGRISTERPIPFPLAGNAQAVLFLIPCKYGEHGELLTGEEHLGPDFFRGLGVLVEYGAGGRRLDRPCDRISAVDHRLFGSTVIPGATSEARAEQPRRRGDRSGRTPLSRSAPASRRKDVARRAAGRRLPRPPAQGRGGSSTST